MALLALLMVLGGNPWNLRCLSMPKEAPAPSAVRAEVRASFPWVPLQDAGAIRVGPVWLFALSSDTSISRDGDGTDGQGRYLHRALVAVSPSYRGSLTIRGSRLGKPAVRAQLAFTRGTSRCRITDRPTWCASAPLNETPTLRIRAGGGWRLVRTEIAIGRTGCFNLRATGADLTAFLPLAVPGPDWGTPGW